MVFFPGFTKNYLHYLCFHLLFQLYLGSSATSISYAQFKKQVRISVVCCQTMSVYTDVVCATAEYIGVFLIKRHCKDLGNCWTLDTCVLESILDSYQGVIISNNDVSPGLGSCRINYKIISNLWPMSDVTPAGQHR